MELEENMPLLEWLANNYKKFGAGLEIITDRSQVWVVFGLVLGNPCTSIRRAVSTCEDLEELVACFATPSTSRFENWSSFGFIVHSAFCPFSSSFFQSMQLDDLDGEDYDLDDY